MPGLVGGCYPLRLVAMNGGDLNYLWAWRFVDGLAAAGVRRVVVSPGSRSAPLALAAARHDSLACTVVVDERDAAFFALGQARVTGRPSVLLATSGTAAAHHLPAILEASAADVPLISVTADRPPELQGRGALQTVEQQRLFGPHVRAFFDLGPPAAEEGALRGPAATAAVAVARSLDPRPGPVHVNAPFRPPLEPTAWEALPSAATSRFFPPRRLPSEEAVAALAEACARARHGLILAGPLGLGEAGVCPAALALSRRLGFPLLAEAASQCRFAGAGDGVVGLFEMFSPLWAGPRFQPELVLQLGAFPTSPGWGRFFDSDEACERWVVAPHGWHDPANRAAGVVTADVAATLSALASALGEGEPRDPAWASRWYDAERVVAEILARQEQAEAVTSSLSEEGAARATLRGMPDGALLHLANSLAIRTVDLACPPAMARVGVLAQRGVSGIDGSVAAAAGAASVADRPVVALVGDLALLHDVGGLATCRHAAAPVVLVVLANRGGRIFELLPVADGRLDGATLGALFIAGEEVDLQRLAEAFSLGYRRAEHGAELSAAVAQACGTDGGVLVEAVIRGEGVRARRRALREAVHGWLHGEAG